jgi:putative transposase
MGTNTQSDADSDSPDTDARIDAKTPTTTANTVTPILADSATDHHVQSRFFDVASEETDDDLDGLVAAVTTIAQS